MIVGVNGGAVARIVVTGAFFPRRVHPSAGILSAGILLSVLPTIDAYVTVRGLGAVVGGGVVGGDASNMRIMDDTHVWEFVGEDMVDGSDSDEYEENGDEGECAGDGEKSGSAPV